ncbi:MAG: hypothetical protein FWC53_01155 [Firmicutes bacterium]|nr:hypothetical protein [Bacillota bacterium]
MIKAVIKEIIIFLLLLVSIALILGILFYDYMPINKTVPSKVEPYNIPADIQNELNTAEEQNQNVIKTYSIDSSALTTYNKGKVNPFAAYEPPAAANSANTAANAGTGSTASGAAVAGTNSGTNTGTGSAPTGNADTSSASGNANTSSATGGSSNTNSEGTFYEIPPTAPKGTGK